jgi:hypothetical protein
MVSKVVHGTGRVNMIKDFKVLLASKDFNIHVSASQLNVTFHSPVTVT